MPYCNEKKVNRKQLRSVRARAIAEICNCVGVALPSAIDFDSAPAAGGLLTKKNV